MMKAVCKVPDQNKHLESTCSNKTVCPTFGSNQFVVSDYWTPCHLSARLNQFSPIDRSWSAFLTKVTGNHMKNHISYVGNISHNTITTCLWDGIQLHTYQVVMSRHSHQLSVAWHAITSTTSVWYGTWPNQPQIQPYLIRYGSDTRYAMWQWRLWYGTQSYHW